MTVADVDKFYTIYGGVEGGIKGKTVRKTSVEVNVEENRTEIPDDRQMKELFVLRFLLFI